MTAAFCALNSIFALAGYMYLPDVMTLLCLADVAHVNCALLTSMSLSLHHNVFLFSAHYIVLLCHQTGCFFLNTKLLWFCSLAHEGSTGLSWDFPTSSFQSAGRDRVLPGAWAQRCAPKLSLRTEGAFERSLADWDQPWWGGRSEMCRLWAGGWGPVPENGEFAVCIVCHASIVEIHKEAKNGSLMVQ